MTALDLSASWTLWDTADPTTRYPAPVPGSVHDALLAADALPNAQDGYGERAQLWVGERTWVYERTILVSSDLLAEETIELVCEGLDTFCQVQINGTSVGLTDNMFRRWRFPVKDTLRPGENTLRLTFAPATAVMAAQEATRHLPAWNEPGQSDGDWGVLGRGYVRKQACHHGWDWGPQCPSAGPWLPLRLEAYTGARIGDWRVTQIHHDDGRVTVRVFVQPTTGEDLVLHGAFARQGQVLAAVEESFFGGVEWEFTLDDPALWWPNGMGAQPLYDLSLELRTPGGIGRDRVEQRLGLREVTLVQEKDSWGRSFYFQVNGQRFFTKGSNWIPLDAHPSGQDLERRYRRDLESAAAVHMNMLRVWGGGYFAHDVFYDLCDELGLLIWQDMLFGCGTYPVWDEAFRQNVWHEVVDNAQRLRHHACLACWCGNNELEQGFCHPTKWLPPGEGDNGAGKMAWASYEELFARLIPSALTVADPDRPYFPGSPHSPETPRDGASDQSGDVHSWGGWFEGHKAERYREMNHRFFSEFGYQSLPEADHLAAFAPEGEALSTASAWLAFRQRSQPRNARIIAAVQEYFGDAAAAGDFATFCHLSQLTQGLILKTGIESMRTRFPRVGGATYWQINDRWAAPTWATLDHHGHWKASHYLAQRFFAPRAIIGIEDANTGKVDVFVVADDAAKAGRTAEITVTDGAGRELASVTYPVSPAEPSEPAAVGTVDVATMLPAGTAFAHALVWLTLREGGAVVAENLVTFVRPKDLLVPPPQLRVEETIVGDGSRRIAVKNGPTPALWVTLSAGWPAPRFSENCFCLQPNAERNITASGPVSNDPVTGSAFSTVR